LLVLRPAGKLPFDEAPEDDRDLADIHLALYNDVVVFDHATKLAYVIAWVSSSSTAGDCGEGADGLVRGAESRLERRLDVRSDHFELV
jgi:anthranilate synthase component 1